MKKDTLPSILDREVRTTQNDAFGHKDLAEALGSLIESNTHKPPYSIGLLGSWGSGKSSIKELYLSSLSGDEKDLERDENGCMRAEKVKSITFNAWRFGGENIKRALIRHVYVSIGGKPDEIMDRLFRRFERSIKEPKSLKRIGQDLLDHWAGQTIQLIILFLGILGFIGVVFGIGKLFGIENNWMLSGVSAAGLTALGIIAKELFVQNRLLMPIFNEGLRIEGPVSSAEQYEQLLLEQLGKFKNSKDGKKCERIVVFLDDLDRLSSEEMVAGLDAVRTFLEIDSSNLPNGLGLIFVISCDEGLVADALAKRSRRNGDIPGTISDAASARRYLDRIFQFRLDVPEIPKQDMRSFVAMRIKEGLPSLVKDFEDRNINLESVVNRLVHYDVSSPRNAIQLMNAFSQSWWLACRREREGAGSQRAGGLSTGAVTEHPIALAAICGLRVNFPEFYQDLLANSEFIDRFTYAFCRTSPVDPETIPDSVRPQLKKYTKSEHKESQWELDEKHRPLRSYLSSLQGLRWPIGGLMPLLQLSQDPISREFGPRERSLFDAIRNGDTPALLEVLDLNTTDRPLSENDVRKIAEIYRQLERTGALIEQENALACFAGVSNRLPKVDARHLLTPLARQIRDSEGLRWRVGLSRIEQILPNLEVVDRREVAASLIDDILNAKGRVRFQTENKQFPSLDQAREMVLQAQGIVLKVRKEDGLAEGSDQILRSWLLNRRISVEGAKESLEIPFVDLEECVAEHESHLLPLLGQEYSDQAIAQFEQESYEEINCEQILSRILKVFKSLSIEGADSIDSLQVQLIRLLKVKEQRAVDKAVEFLVSDFKTFESELLTGVLLGLTERLVNEENDSDEWPMDWKHAGEALIDMLEKRPEVLDESLSESISELLLGWCSHEECASLVVQLSSMLLTTGKSPDSIEKVVSKYTQGLLSDSLSRECLDWTATNFSKLSKSNKDSIIKVLNALVQNENVQDEEALRYVRFISELQSGALKSEFLNSHFNQLRTNLLNFRGTQSYLASIFPVVPVVYEYFPKKEAGKWLQNLFNQTQPTVPNFDIIHGIMADSWPEKSDELAGYDPEVLYKNAVTVVNGQTNIVAVKGVVQSLAGFLERGIVDEKHGPQVANLACKLWTERPKLGFDALKKVSVAPTLGSIVNLTKGRDLEEEENQEVLSEVLRWVSQLLDVSSKSDVTHQILQDEAIVIDSDNDYLLHEWLRINDESTPEILKVLIYEKDLNVEQSRRVWFQLLSHAEVFNFDDILNMLANILGKEPAVAQLIHKHKDDLERLFAKGEDRFHLAAAVLKGAISSTDQATMNRLTEWAKQIGGEAALDSIEKDTEVTKETFETLSRVFPKAKALHEMKIANVPEEE